MAQTNDFLSESSDGAVMDVTVQPRASKSELVGIHEGRLKIRIAAPPVDGEANEELIRFVARFFDLPKSAVRIVRGHQGKRKRLLLGGVGCETVRARLDQHGVRC